MLVRCKYHNELAWDDARLRTRLTVIAQPSGLERGPKRVQNCRQVNEFLGNGPCDRRQETHRGHHTVTKAVVGSSYRLPVGTGVLVYAEYHYSGFGLHHASDVEIGRAHV